MRGAPMLARGAISTARVAATPFMTDTFTGTDATLLQAHTGEGGVTWTRGPSLTVDCTIQSNRIFSTGVAHYYSSIAPATADYDVTVAVRIVTNGAFYAAATGRHDSAVQSLYWARNSTGSLQLFKTVSGTSTQLGSSVSAAVNAGEDHTIMLRMRGDQISAYWDGALLIGPLTDAAITAAGKPGVRINSGSTTTGYHIDSISAVNG